MLTELCSIVMQLMVGEWKRNKSEGVSASRYWRGEGLCSIKGRAQLETSRRVQSKNDPESGCVRRGPRREGRDRGLGDEETGRPKGKQVKRVKGPT